jgi:hypothetical protein
MPSAARTASFNVLLMLAALGVSLGVSELLLRAFGYSPLGVTSSQEIAEYLASWSAYDPELGWINRPSVRQHHGDGWFTTLADGSRVTRQREEIPAASHVVIVGDSYAQGLGVSDELTYAWRLQGRFPRYDFRNLGTGGYGSYQSGLALQRFSKTHRKPVAAVVFGFGSYMGVRDRATAAHVAAFQPKGDIRAFVPPHLERVGGRFEERAATYHRVWSAARRSALANLLQDALLRLGVPTDDYSEATEAVFRESIRRLKRAADGHGSRFLLAVTYVQNEQRPLYAEFFRQAGIDFVDCSPPDMPFAHPDPLWHRRHADCIGDALQARVP